MSSSFDAGGCAVVLFASTLLRNSFGDLNTFPVDDCATLGEGLAMGEVDVSVLEIGGRGLLLETELDLIEVAALAGGCFVAVVVAICLATGGGR